MGASSSSERISTTRLTISLAVSGSTSRALSVHITSLLLGLVSRSILAYLPPFLAVSEYPVIVPAAAVPMSNWLSSVSFSVTSVSKSLLAIMSSW